MRNIQNGGPLVNSEYYAGWLSHWQEPLSDIHPDGVVDKMKTLLALNASFNFYMFHGGTNFGFTSGANTNDTTERVGYLPQLTSYDFNAPLDEAGDPTEKYFMIKKALEEKVSFYSDQLHVTSCFFYNLINASSSSCCATKIQLLKLQTLRSKRILCIKVREKNEKCRRFKSTRL